VDALPLSPRLVAGMAALAVPLNLLLLALLASQSPELFLVWLGTLAVAGGYYLLRTRGGTPLGTADYDL
jgi:APA family basic amino acid/polyamine antiporter